MPVEIETEYAIIGAGIAGASVAYELAKKGQSVAILEMEDTPGYHSTGRSAAFYAPVYGNHSVRCLTKLSGSFYENTPTGFCEHSLLSPRGALFIANKESESKLKKFYDDVKGLSNEVKLEAEDFARNKISALKEKSVTTCVWDPTSQELDVAALHQGYLKQAKAFGANLFVDSEVKKIRKSASNWLIETQNNEFSAKVIVNAAGAWCDHIAELAAIERIGLQPKKRSVCTVPVQSKYDTKNWPLVVDINEKFYFKPEGDGLLISPADETLVEPMDAFTDQLDLAIAIDRVSKVIDVPLQRISHEWAGLRSFVSDKSPVIGFEPNEDGFFWFAGQGGYGIQMASGAAKLAASMLLSKPIPSELNKMNFELSSVTTERFR